MNLVSNGLSCEGLARARVADKQHDHALSFALDDVVKQEFVGGFCFHERCDEVFVASWEYYFLKGSVVPGNVADIGHRKFGPALVLE